MGFLEGEGIWEENLRVCNGGDRQREEREETS